MLQCGQVDGEGLRRDEIRKGRTYSFLCQLTRTLVFAVTEEFDDAAFVGCESMLSTLVSI